MRTRITETIARPALLAAALVPAAGMWLVAVDAGGHGSLNRWLLVVLVGAPAAALLAPLAARLAARPARREATALVALAAAVATTLGALAAGALDGSGALAPGRGLLLALAVTVPVAAVALAWRPAPAAAHPADVGASPAQPADAAPPARPARRAGGTTRRGFIQIGAAGSVAVAGLSRVIPAAKAQPVPFRLTITEGDVVMEDGTPVFFRGFRATDAVKDVPSIPGPPIGNTGPGVKGREIFEGDEVQIVVANSTPREHVFVIDKGDTEAPSAPLFDPVTIGPHETATINFTPHEAGSYIYRDADRNNRLLGMYGAFIVMPAGGSGALLPYRQEAPNLPIRTELRSQHAWILSDVDPVLGELARVQRRTSKIDYPLTKVLPRYFLINGETGVEATRNEELTIPVIPLHVEGAAFAGVLIRCINTGVATHSLHWHGNHVFIVMRNAVPEREGLVFEKDVQRIEPLQRIEVILPAHTGFEAFPPLNQNHPKVKEQHFPMHCHAEMSQTAAGGSYPFGMLTDWHLVDSEQTAVEVRQRLADERRDGRQPVSADQVQAAIDERAGNSGPGGGDGKSGGSNGSGSSGGSGDQKSSSGKGDGKG
ncbi:MAG TPA: hypothetical protein VGJ32_01310 [Solirubrobacteraceae bacterium]